MKKNEFETNRKIYKRTYLKQVLSCSYCPPNKGENSTKKYGRHGPKKKRKRY